MRNITTIKGQTQTSRTVNESSYNKPDIQSDKESIKIEFVSFQNSEQNNKVKTQENLSFLEGLEPRKALSQGSPASQSHQEIENLNLTSEKLRSPFQNFQKHLVVTLKKDMKIIQKPQKDCIEHLAHRMWSIFKSSKYFSKKGLFCLFGVATQIRNSKKSDIHKQFSQLYELYPLEEIELAQQYLRRQVICQGSNLMQKGTLRQGRRMQKSKQFQQYFSVFLCELRSGGVSRRISKSSKQCCLHLEQDGEDQE